MGASSLEDAPGGRSVAVLIIDRPDDDRPEDDQPDDGWPATPARRSEPVAAIGHPPGDIEDGDGRGDRPPQGQDEVRHQAQHGEDHPENLALHWIIVSAAGIDATYSGAFSCHGSFPSLVAAVIQTAMKRSLKEIAELVQARVVGDAAIEVTGVSSIASSGPGDLVFVDSEKSLGAALTSKAGAVIVGKFAESNRGSKTLLICDQPRLAFARAARLFEAEKTRAGSVHPTAIVHESARLGTGVTIAERVVIHDGVEVGEGTWVGAGCVVAAGVQIGKDCALYPNVTVYSGTRIGDRVLIHAGAVLGSDGFGYVRDEKNGHYEKFPQVGRLEIGDDVEIGANATVDRGALDVTRIGRGTKIDNLVHVGHNVQIGEDVVIAAQTGISGSAVLENAVIVGGQVGIADHVRIESGAILGAQSGIPTKKVIRGKGIVFWGTPARPIREYLKELAVLARLAKKG